MSKLLRVVLWGLALAVLLAVVWLPPHGLTRLRLLALLLATLAGAYALAYAVIGTARRRLGAWSAAGSALLAGGLFLIGAHLLPHAGGSGSMLTTSGVVLFIGGLALQVLAEWKRVT